MKRSIVCAAVMLLFVAATTRSAVTFDLTFPDVASHTGQNWDDPTYGAAARVKLGEVLNEFGRAFADNAAIQLVITSSMTTVYSAGSYAASYQLQAGGLYDPNTYVKIRTGADMNGAAADGGIEYSFNFAGLHYEDRDGNGVLDMRDFILNLPGLTRHEAMHLAGLVSGIDPTTRANSRPNRHDYFLFDSAGRPFLNADGSVSATANLDDAASYFDPIGSGPNYQIRAAHDFSHLIGITFPFRELANRDDRTYLATLGYPLAPPVGKLLNISTRLRVQTGDAALIAGFIVTGADPKRLVIRAIGPSTGTPGALNDPTLEVFQGSTLYVPLQNNWRDNQEAELQSTGLAPTNDLESATVRMFPPGSYTAIVRGNGNTSGIGSVELYDLTSDSDSRVANISTRGFVEAGDNVMIGGFIVGEDPSLPADLIIRALGPSLAAAGVPSPLGDPVLTLYDANGVVVRQNDNWRETQATELTASGFAPASDNEAAMLISRPAGATTAVVRGKDGATGNALVEVYRLR